ncbi:efflux RND transporter periplasmic adaptor subunit [Chloroflexota bacterium]
MKSWRIVVVLLLCLVLVSSAACNPFGGNGEELSQQLVEVVRGDLTVSVSGSGKIQVTNEARLTFGIGGRVDKIYVEEGDTVTEDEVLAKLDTDALELALTQAQVARAQAQEALAQAQVALTQAQVALTTQQVAVTQAQATLQTAEYNLEEAQELYTEQDIANAEAAVVEAEYYLEYAQWALEHAVLLRDKRDSTYRVYNAVTSLGIAERNLDEMLSAPDEDEIAILETQIEVAKQSLELAQESLEPAQESLELAEQSPELAQQSLELAQQSLELAQQQLDEAIITAPFDGVVASVDADEDDTVSTVTTIIHLIDLSTMELEIEVDEIDIPGVKLGQRAIIEVDALSTLPLEGEATFISSLGEEETGVVLYEVKISFDAPEGPGLRAGMSAEADIIINERNNVLLVPSRAIKQDSQDNPVVKVIVGEQTEERQVVTGISDGFETEIVDGLDEGEVVVVER